MLGSSCELDSYLSVAITIERVSGPGPLLPQPHALHLRWCEIPQ